MVVIDSLFRNREATTDLVPGLGIHELLVMRIVKTN